MKVSKIALRNILRQKKRTFLLGGAIAFGMMIIIVINSFTSGIVVNIKDNFTSLLGGHVYISGKEITPSGREISAVRDTRVLKEVLKPYSDRILRTQVRSRSFGELIFVSKSTLISVDGVNWKEEGQLLDRLVIQSGSKQAAVKKKAIVIPEKAAKDLGVKAGESVLLRISTVTGQQNVGEFTVAAIVRDSSGFGISSAYADIGYLNSLLGLKPDEYQTLNITLKNIEDIDAFKADIVKKLTSLGKMEPEKNVLAGETSSSTSRQHRMGAFFGGGMQSSGTWKGTRFSVMTLNDMMAPVQNLVSVMHWISRGLFFIFILIIMVGLLNTFRMVLIERTKEIGTMRAIGMQRSDVRNSFLMEALYLSLGGAAAGLAAAFIVMLVLSLIPFTGDSAFQFFLKDHHLLLPVQPGNIIATIIILAGITLFSAYFPAKKAARLKPAEAIRTTY